MSGLNKSQENAKVRKREKARSEADKIYGFTLEQAERFAKASNDLVSLIMLANLKFNGWYACRIDGVKIFFIRQEN